jgi:hypothetical protein
VKTRGPRHAAGKENSTDSGERSLTAAALQNHGAEYLENAHGVWIAIGLVRQSGVEAGARNLQGEEAVVPAVSLKPAHTILDRSQRGCTVR